MQRYLQGNYKFNFKVALKNIGDKTTKPARMNLNLIFSIQKIISIRFLCLIFLVLCPIFVDKCK